MKFWRDLKTMAKIMLAFIAMGACMFAFGLHAVQNASRMETAMSLLYERDMRGELLVRDARAKSLRVQRAWNDVAREGTHAAAAEAKRVLAEQDQGYRQDLDKADPLFVTPESRAMLSELHGDWRDYVGILNEALDFATAGQMDKATQTVGRAKPFTDRMDRTVAQLVASKERLAQQDYEEDKALAASVQRSLVLFVLFVTAAGIAISYFVARSIAVPLGAAVGALSAVAAGDFTRKLDVDSKDEIGDLSRALNKAVSSVKNAITEVRDVSTRVVTASEQLTATAVQISTGAQQQAASLEETAASLEEIASTVKRNADNARQAADLSSSSRDVAEKGARVVESAVGAMSDINASSKRIADITTTIDEIAFQTNLLALNAAVEAARAGEQGRGFAVVAAEVRSLAQRSAASAKEIKALIQEAVGKIERGTEHVTDSGQALTEIVSSVRKATDMIGEIAAASREQNTGIDQVNRAVAQMDQVTQSNASETEHMSATADSLARQAAQLRELVARFKIDEGGRSSLGGEMAPAWEAPRKKAAREESGARPIRRAASVALQKTGTDGFEEF